MRYARDTLPRVFTRFLLSVHVTFVLRILQPLKSMLQLFYSADGLNLQLANCLVIALACVIA